MVAHHAVRIEDIAPHMLMIVFAALIVLIILAVLVATGRITQKGPHGRGGPFGPQS
jgi:uncharacterized membrane protein